MAEDTPEVKRVKALMKEVYDDGFNIYKCLNKVKKQMKSRIDFPPQAIIWTCESYLRQKPKVLDHWTWFVRVFRASSERFFAEQHVAEGEKHKKEPVAQSIKNIMKGIK